MNIITIEAPAKINTVLRVVGRRPDGYHDLVMVMEKLGLRDEITMESIDGDIELAIDGTTDQGMEAKNNLICRAADAFRSATNETRGVRIQLKKRIPVAAGLGGGSSDAASTLVGLNELWGHGWTREQLAGLGVRLGADVPFFCHEGPAVVEGIGDRIRPLEKLPNLYVLLINPGFAVSTPWVYGEWDRLHAQSGANTLENGLTVQDRGVRVPPLFDTFHDVTTHLANDLEEVTVPAYPEIREIKEYLMNAGAQGALMSGSGPTVFGLFEDARTRDTAASKVQVATWRVFATEN